MVLAYFLLLLLILSTVFFFPERKWKGGREGERKINIVVRETQRLVASWICSDWGGDQICNPDTCLWPWIEPATFWCTGWGSNHWAHQSGLINLIKKKKSQFILWEPPPCQTLSMVPHFRPGTCSPSQVQTFVHNMGHPTLKMLFFHFKQKVKRTNLSFLGELVYTCESPW